MFGPIGLPEAIFIVVLALLIFGPRRLPELGRTVGKAMGEFRRATTELKRSINTEIALEDDEPRQALARRPAGLEAATALPAVPPPADAGETADVGSASTEPASTEPASAEPASAEPASADPAPDAWLPGPPPPDLAGPNLTGPSLTLPNVAVPVGDTVARSAAPFPGVATAAETAPDPLLSGEEAPGGPASQTASPTAAPERREDRGD